MASTRAEQAAELGISVRHLYRLLAAERAGAAVWAPSPDGPPFVPITDRPTHDRYCYRLDDDGESRLPMGLMRIGIGPDVDRAAGPSHRPPGPRRLEGKLAVRHYNEGTTEATRPVPKFKPKRPKKGKI